MASEIPPSLRQIGHFIKIANEYETRDRVINYWCLFRAVQDAMKIDSSSKEAVNYLTKLLTTLETIKKSNLGNDAFTNDVVAQSYIEEQSRRMFNYALEQENLGNYNNKLIKAFYTSGYLFELLSLFGELDENIQSAKKYAKWRATYIHNCLKNGEVPVPASGANSYAKKEDDDDGMAELTRQLNDISGGPAPTNPSHSSNPPSNPFGGPTPTNTSQYGAFPPISNQFGAPPHQITDNQYGAQQSMGNSQYGARQPSAYPSTIITTNPPIIAASQPAVPQPAPDLNMESFLEARKYVKYALSAIDYEDAKTAVENLYKAIGLLQKH